MTTDIDPTEAAPEDDVIQPLDGPLGERVVAAMADAPSHIADRLMRAFQGWIAAVEFRQKEGKRLTEVLTGRIAQFNEAMQVGHATQNDQILKLSVVEARWQDLETARDDKRETLKNLKDDIKAAEQKIKDLIAEAKSGQTSMFDVLDVPPEAQPVTDEAA